MEWLAMMGFLILLLLYWRTFYIRRSRLEAKRKKRQILRLARCTKAKYHLLEEVNRLQKEQEALEAALREARQAHGWEAGYKEAVRDTARCQGWITRILTELQAEQWQRRFKKEQLRVAERSSSRIRSLTQESNLLASEIAELKVAVLNLNKERLQRAVTDAMSEKAGVQESQTQLVQEAQGWKEQGGKLISRRVRQDAQAGAEQVPQVPQDKEKQAEARPGHLLPTAKGGASGIPEDCTQREDSRQEVRSQPQRGPGFADPPEGPSERLICGAQVNPSFQTLEEQRSGLHTQLLGAEQANKALAESLQQLQTQRASLQSENTELRREHQKLQLKLSVRTEVYERTVLRCHQSLKLAAKARAEQKKKLPILEEVRHVTEELETYRKRAQDMQEEWEKTVSFYQRQVTSMQREARANWAKAAIAERHLQELRRQNARTRQLLRAAELKASLVGKDQATLSVTNSTSGPERSPRGLSSRPRPRPRRLSTRSVRPLPTLWEEPLGSSASSPAGAGSS